MKDVEVFAKEDQAGHLMHSEEEIRMHADRSSKKTIEERKSYFQGIAGVFPLMFLGHYHEWWTETDIGVYMETFVPEARNKYEKEISELLDDIYADYDDHVWEASLCNYVETYPYAFLQEYVTWNGKDQKKFDIFVKKEKQESVTEVQGRIKRASSHVKAREEMILWLGTVFPFELIVRFHNAMM